MKRDVLVIGAGPAGLAAARAAGAAGASVLVVDQAREPGGQLACRVDRLEAPAELEGRRSDEAARELVAAARAAGAEIWTETPVWGLFPGAAAVIRGGVAASLEAPAIVVAAGSIPAPYPFTGWTLPGVMTFTAVERLINREGYLPGRLAVVLGDGPEAQRVAWLLELCGAEVERVASIDSAAGHGRVAEVTAGGRTFPCDLVVLAAGRLPQAELLNAAGCPLRTDGAPEHDEAQRTPLPGVLVAGSAAGVGSPAASLLTGEIAGVTAAELAGALPAGVAASRRAGLLARAPGARTPLTAPRIPLPVDEFAMVCRCEEIPRTEVADAIRAYGARTVDDIKRITRCGMGFCQGKNCTHTVRNLLAAEGVAGLEEIAPLRLRPPVRPIRIRELAPDGSPKGGSSGENL